MKRIVLLTTAWMLTTAVSAFADHEYIPFATTGKQWVGSIPATGMVMQTINGDTIIEDVPYQRLELYMRPDNYSVNRISYIRETDKKVYLKRKLSDPESLIFDFNLLPGDSVVVTESELWKDEYMTREYTICMDSIETKELNGVERNFYYVHYKSEASESENSVLTDLWIEGIGAVQVAILNMNARYGQAGVTRFEYYYEPETSFIYPEYKTPVDFTALTTVERESSAFIRDGSVLKSDGMLVLYDLSGVCRAEGCRIDLSSLPKGVYVVRCLTSDGVVTADKVVW